MLNTARVLSATLSASLKARCIHRRAAFSGPKPHARPTERGERHPARSIRPRNRSPEPVMGFCCLILPFSDIKVSAAILQSMGCKRETVTATGMARNAEMVSAQFVRLTSQPCPAGLKCRSACMVLVQPMGAAPKCATPDIWRWRRTLSLMG